MDSLVLMHIPKKSYRAGCLKLEVAACAAHSSTLPKRTLVTSKLLSTVQLSTLTLAQHK